MNYSISLFPPVTFLLDAIDAPSIITASSHIMSNSSQCLATLYDQMLNTVLQVCKICSILCSGTHGMICKEQFNVRGLWHDGCFRIWEQVRLSFLC